MRDAFKAMPVKTDRNDARAAPGRYPIYAGRERQSGHGREVLETSLLANSARIAS